MMKIWNKLLSKEKDFWQEQFVMSWIIWMGCYILMWQKSL